MNLLKKRFNVWWVVSIKDLYLFDEDGNNEELKKLFYNFYGDLLLVSTILLWVFTVKGSLKIWECIPYLGVALSVAILILTIIIIVKNKKIGICEMYSLFAAVFTVIH